ncbi:MAG: calcium/sodium antiporter [Candidatus Cryptobacteroides sp.]
MTIILLLVGLGLIVLGADWMVEGASFIARKAGVSEFVIGLTVIGFGTSSPELVVSLAGAFQGNSDIAIGNVVGSNIFNILFILGITSVLMPVTMTRENRHSDIPLTVLVSILLLCFAMNKSLFGLGPSDSLSRIEGVVFLLLFFLFVFWSLRPGGDRPDVDESRPLLFGKQLRSVWPAVIVVLSGLAALVFGGSLMVNSAEDIARSLGVSDKVIAVTVLAGGTSLPELTTCVVASLKHKDQLVIGNILGSNVFNILFILGCSALVTPLSFSGIGFADAALLVLSALLLLLWTWTGTRFRIDRWEGAAMLLLFAAYFINLFHQS